MCFRLLYCCCGNKPDSATLPQVLCDLWSSDCGGRKEGSLWGGKDKGGSEGVVCIEARARACARAHAMWMLVCFGRLLPKSIDGGRKLHRHCSQSCPSALFSRIPAGALGGWCDLTDSGQTPSLVLCDGWLPVRGALQTQQ